jgi:hypothetical protein
MTESDNELSLKVLFETELHAPAALHLGKDPWYPLDRRLGGFQSRSGQGGKEKNSQPLLGLEPLIIQPVTQRYPGITITFGC